MSVFENPYQSPEASAVPEALQNSSLQFTVNMLKNLYEASPWLQFIGVLGYIGTGFMIFSGIIATLGTMAAGSLFEGISGAVGLVFLIYIPAGILMFFPAHFAFKFGQKIKSYKFTNSAGDLEEAFKNNKSYWKFMGILYIIFLALVPVIFIVSIVFGVVAALGVF